MKRRKTVAICAAIAAWALLISETLKLAFGSAVWWTSLIVFFFCWLIVRFFTRDIAETHSKYLDEYERSLKARAFSFGFWTAVSVGIVLMVFLAIVGQSNATWACSLLQSVWQLVLGACLLVAATPTFWLGWTTRSPSQE